MPCGGAKAHEVLPEPASAAHYSGLKGSPFEHLHCAHNGLNSYFESREWFPGLPLAYFKTLQTLFGTSANGVGVIGENEDRESSTVGTFVGTSHTSQRISAHLESTCHNY
jgi:hypothetical protein